MYKASKYKYDFLQYETIRSFGENIYNGKMNIDKAEMDRGYLLKKLVEFNNKSIPRTIEEKDKKRDTYESAYSLFEGRELILNNFKSRIFLIKARKNKELKILTPKKMLQRLVIALAHVKAGNTSKNLLNKVRQIIYFFASSKRNH